MGNDAMTILIDDVQLAVTKLRAEAERWECAADGKSAVVAAAWRAEAQRLRNMAVELLLTANRHLP